jgi:cytosine/adenosine deaminase-related metal-dependent hydrolase
MGLMRYLCEAAWLGGTDVARDVLVTVEGDRIGAVEAGARLPRTGVALSGLTLPGFANVHSHAFHRALRGRTERPGSFCTWRDEMYEVAAALDPGSYQRLARAAYAEMVLAGFTVVGEFHYLHHGAGGRPYEDPNAMGSAILSAAGDAGIRMTLLDACYLERAPGQAVAGVQERFSDGVHWESQSENGCFGNFKNFILQKIG